MKMRDWIIVNLDVSEKRNIEKLKKHVSKVYNYNELGLAFEYKVKKWDDRCLLEVRSNASGGIMDDLSSFCQGWIACAGI